METKTKNNGLLLHSVGKKYITTKLLKGTNIKITYKNGNTIVKISVYTNSSKIEKLSTSGIYHLTRPDFGKKNTGRIGILFRKRYNEHLQSFKHQNPNRHLQNTYMILDTHLVPWKISFCKKGKLTNSLEKCCIHLRRKEIIQESTLGCNKMYGVVILAQRKDRRQL
jgi:hypothetical protein